MKSLTQFINEGLPRWTIEYVREFIQMEKDLGFDINGTDLDMIVDVFVSHYGFDDICKVLKISTSPKDTDFSKKQKIKTEFRKLA